MPTNKGTRYKKQSITKRQNDSWEKYAKTLAEQPDHKFTHKQWRKIGRELVRKAGGQLMKKLWSGQIISGVDWNYDEMDPDDYLPRYPVVDKVRERLIADGVMPLI